MYFTGKLKRVFGKGLDERIITVPDRGLMWRSLSISQRAEEFPTDKVTYLVAEQRLFLGENEILLNRLQWAILGHFLVNKKTYAFDHEFSTLWTELTGQPLDPQQFRIYFRRVNERLEMKLIFSRNERDGVWLLDTSKINFIDSK